MKRSIFKKKVVVVQDLMDRFSIPIDFLQKLNKSKEASKEKDDQKPIQSDFMKKLVQQIKDFIFQTKEKRDKFNSCLMHSYWHGSIFSYFNIVDEKKNLSTLKEDVFFKILYSMISKDLFFKDQDTDINKREYFMSVNATIVFQRLSHIFPSLNLNCGINHSRSYEFSKEKLLLRELKQSKHTIKSPFFAKRRPKHMPCKYFRVN